MDQFELESSFLSGVLGSVQNILSIMGRSKVNFISYLTSRELRFVFNAAMTVYSSYSGVLTESLLVSMLVEKGASDVDVLKYRSLFRSLKRREVSEADFKYATDRLVDNYVSRGLIDSMLRSQEILQKDGNGRKAFDVLEEGILSIKDQVISKDVREISTNNITEEVVLYDDMVKNPDKYSGIKIGLDKLDEITGGFRSGELVVAVGATKVGKSIFLLTCQHNTMKSGYNNVYVSVEMPAEQCRRRLVSRLTRLQYKRIKNTKLTSEELAHMRATLEDFEKTSKGHSMIVDVPRECTPRMVEAKIRSLMRTMRVDVVIIDYLLLMSPSISYSKMSREEKITQVSLELKQMSRSLGMPVITASQVVAKAAERRERTTDESYDWTELSQAKSVAAHADWVLSLKREPDVNILNLGITAGRDGELDSVIPLVIDYGRMMIGNYSEGLTGVQDLVDPTATPVAAKEEMF